VLSNRSSKVPRVNGPSYWNVSLTTGKAMSESVNPKNSGSSSGGDVGAALKDSTRAIRCPRTRYKTDEEINPVLQRGNFRINSALYSSCSRWP